MHNFSFIRGISLAVIGCLFLASACSKRDGAKLAEVDGVPVLASEFEKTAGKEFFRQREAFYRLEQQKLDEYIGALLLTKEARKRGISVATLLDQEVDSKVLPVTDEEVSAFYKANKARLTVKLEKIQDQIREYLRQQRTQTQKVLYLQTLRSTAEIKTYLNAPPVFRVSVSVTGAPFKGPANAPVTIVKFEDFQCPFCKRVQPTFEELFKLYKGKIRVVHKDFPLDSIHHEARQAAEAARCAFDQGKFWEYHDKAYENAPKATPTDLERYASEVGLNTKVFEQCLNGGKFKLAVQRDLAEGSQLGITGTPVFFINGRELSGAQPIEQFTRIIDEELARAGKSQPSG